MSTKTNFKRIALVAVAALGMGVLSSAPSQAVIPVTSLTLTASATAGTASEGGGNGAAASAFPGAVSDSTTGASVTVSFLGVTALTDSVSLTIAPKSKPSLQATYPKALFTVTDTSSSTANPVVTYSLDSVTTVAGQSSGQLGNSAPLLRGLESGTAVRIGASSDANRYYTVTAKIHLDSATARVAGTYVYTVIATPFDGATAGGAVSANVKSVDVTITVSAGSATASSVHSRAVMNSGTSFTGAISDVDSEVSVVSTASTANRGVIRVYLRTSTNTTTADESVTVVATRGSVGSTSGVAIGKNVTMQYNRSQGYIDVFVFSDGTAGVGTITISTPSVTFAAKAVSFYSTTATKLTVVNGSPTLKVGSNTMTALGVGVLWVKATDANGNTVVANAAGTSGVWAYSSSTTVVSDSGTACTYNSTTTYHHCALTGVAAGTATITVANLGTNLEAATVKGDKTASVTVSAATPATLSLAFDKATYAPGERGFIYVSAKDSAGNTLPGQALTNMMSSTGISVSKGSITGPLGAALTLDGADNTSPTTAVRVASVDTCDTLATGLAVRCITFMAPTGGGDIEITATGGAGLPIAGQVAVKASAKVTDNAAAALAAVTALATTVASLRTLITTLTNLVLKIQKKVRA
jgi:trimeric autotransporter adhesin